MNNKKKLIIGIIFLIVITLVIINIIKPHKKKEIVLKTNGGVPYNWEYTIENTDIIGIEDEKLEEKSHEIVGGEIEKHFILKGLKEGTTIIKFEHRNFVDNSINKTKKYTVKVNKKLEIFIKEIK